MDNTGISPSGCINNRLINCKAPGIYVYNCQDNHIEITNCHIKDCFVHKTYDIDGVYSLSNVPSTSFSPGTTLYDNERKQYIYTNGTIWKSF